MNNKQQPAKKLASVLLIISLPIFMVASCGNPKNTPTEKNSGQDNTTENNNTHSENNKTQQKGALTTTLTSAGINPQQANWVNEALQETALSPAVIAYIAENIDDEFRDTINAAKNKQEIKEGLDEINNEINKKFEEVITALTSVGIHAQQAKRLSEAILETILENKIPFNKLEEWVQNMGGVESILETIKSDDNVKKQLNKANNKGEIKEILKKRL